MSLENYLDDLDEPVDLPVGKADSVIEVSLEDLHSKYKMYELRNVIRDLDVLDKTTALEVFTMVSDLPDSEVGKLTTNPSVSNKNLAVTNLDKADYTIDNKLKDSIIETVSAINQVRSILEELPRTASSISGRLMSLTSKANIPHIVISSRDKESVDLFNSPISVIVALDDTSLDYDKYSGNLVKKYEDIYYSSEYKELASSGDVTLKSFILLLVDSIEECSSYSTELLGFSEQAERLLNEGFTVVDSCSYSIASKINTIRDMLSKVTSFNSSIRREDNVVDRIIELVEFID